MLARKEFERAGDGDVVDVVAGGLRERTFLAPAGHAAVDEPRVLRERDIRAEAEPLHDAGAKAFDEDVGLADQFERRLDAILRLEIDFHDAPPALREIAGVRLDLALARKGDDVRAHVGHQHTGEGPRPDAGEFDDANALQRAGFVGQSVLQNVRRKSRIDGEARCPGQPKADPGFRRGARAV